MKTKQKSDLKIVLIGAGNVATHLGEALHQSGHSILQVYSRTNSSAKVLGDSLNAAFTTNIEDIILSGDVYIFSVKDDVLPLIINQLKPVAGLCIHTAGSLPMDIFKGFTSRYGVFYPLQTFSKARKISFENIPVFVEANNKGDEHILLELANSLSDNVQILSSDKRKYLHIAAVFACNFSNHMYALATEILEDQSLSRDFLIPLIEETADKIKILSPRNAQTGPAVRYDKNIISKHLDLLDSDENKRGIYKLISQSIHERYL